MRIGCLRWGSLWSTFHVINVIKNVINLLVWSLSGPFRSKCLPACLSCSIFLVGLLWFCYRSVIFYYFFSLNGINDKMILNVLVQIKEGLRIYVVRTKKVGKHQILHLLLDSHPFDNSRLLQLFFTLLAFVCWDRYFVWLTCALWLWLKNSSNTAQ